jgi:hypothetical protein
VGVVVSLILIAAGAILVWGVNAESTDFNIDAVGVILMIVGFVAFILSLMMWRSWWGPGAFSSRRTYVDSSGAAPTADPYAWQPPRRARGGGRRRAPTWRPASSVIRARHGRSAAS